MHRINSVNARQDENGTGKKGFNDNADLPNMDATYLTPAWLNSVQEEIAAVVEGFGLTLDTEQNDQLKKAIISYAASKQNLESTKSQLDGRIDDANQALTTAKTQLESTDASLNALTQALMSALNVAEQRISVLESATFQGVKIGQIVEFDRHFNTAAEVAAYMGYGTWQRFAQGRVTVGFSAIPSDPQNIRTFGSEFGNFFHTLTVDEMPSHNHVQSSKYKYYVASATGVADGSTGSADTNDSGDEILVNKVEFNLAEPANVGGNEQFRLSQPSRIVDKWKRVA